METKTQTNDLTIEEFCDRHGACLSGRLWALENCQSMADFWRNEEIPGVEWLAWVATRHGVLTDKELRLFAARCVAEISELLIRPASFATIAAAEQYAHGAIDAAALAKACAAAGVAMHEADSLSQVGSSDCMSNDAAVTRQVRLNFARLNAARVARMLVAASPFRNAYGVYAHSRVTLIDAASAVGGELRDRLGEFCPLINAYLRENFAPDFTRKEAPNFTRKEDRNGDAD